MRPSAQFRIDYRINPSDTRWLRSLTPEELRSEPPVLWAGAEAIRGHLVVEVNGKLAFERPVERPKTVLRNAKVDSARRPGSAGLDGTCLVDWFVNLGLAARHLKEGSTSFAFELSEQSLLFQFVRKGDTVFLTIPRKPADEERHPTSPQFANPILEEPVPLKRLVGETATKIGAFLIDLRRTNPSLLQTPDILRLAAILPDLVRDGDAKRRKGSLS